MELAIILAIFCIVSGSFCSYLAIQKNRDAGAWFVLGLFFSIFALIAIAASPQKEKSNTSAIPRPLSITPQQAKKDIKTGRIISLVFGILTVALLIYVAVARFM